MAQPQTTYDPHMKALLAQVEADWGKPEENLKLLVPYGIGLLDAALYGIDTVNGEVVVVQGQEKNRKTTFMVNIIANIMRNKTLIKNGTRPTIVIDTLESGMPPARYRDALIANVATRNLMAMGHTMYERCPLCGTRNEPACSSLGVTPEFLRYMRRTDDQQRAIDEALAEMYEWPVLIYGAGLSQGDTRNLSAAYGNGATNPQESRWVASMQEDGAKIFVVDHVQQYSFTDSDSAYEKLVRSVAAIGDVVSKHQAVFFVLTQVSLTSAREARNGGTLVASGGSKAAEEANSVISTKYTDGEAYMRIVLEESRRAAGFTLWQPLTVESGTFAGEATPFPIGE